MPVYLARTFQVASWLAAVGFVIALALHIAPAVVYDKNDQPSILTVSWALVGVLATLAVGSWLAARGLATVAFRLIEQFSQAYD